MWTSWNCPMPLASTGCTSPSSLSHATRFCMRIGTSCAAGVDDLPAGRVDDVVLHAPVLARSRGSSAHALDQPLVDLPDESLDDRPAATEVGRHEIERAAIVQQLPHVVGIGFGNRLAGEQPLRLLESEARAFDV